MKTQACSCPERTDDRCARRARRSPRRARSARRTATRVVTRKLVGITAIAGQWGSVKTIVTAKITTKNGKTNIRYTDLGGSYSYHTSRSQYIMSQSLPYLRQEFLRAQSANIQGVSGATNTSQAFEQSLQSALLKLSK